jgi:hypothetical protein
MDKNTIENQDVINLLDNFNNDGYLHLNKFINENLIEDVSRFLDQEIQFLDQPRSELELVIVDDGATLQELESGNVRRATKGNSMLWNILRYSEDLQFILKALLRTDLLFMHMYPSPRIVRPNNLKALVPAHVDRAYNQHLSNFVTLWVPIDSFEVDQGGLDVWPASHNKKYNQESKSGLWYKGIVADAASRKSILVEKGDCVILHENILHASRGNFSNKIRKSIDFRFFRSPQDTTKHYLDCSSWTVIDPIQKNEGF